MLAGLSLPKLKLRINLRSRVVPSPAASLLALVLVAACGAGPAAPGGDSGVSLPEEDGGLVIIGDDPTDQPLNDAGPDQLAVFKQGDTLFDRVFTTADGLGPVYIRQACSSCHDGARKGPGLVQKMALVQADGVTPLDDQSALPYGNTVRPYNSGGGITPVNPPDGGLPSGAQLKLTTRIGPALFGRGYLEAISDDLILAGETAQAARTDGIHGRVNRVSYRSQANPDTTYHRHQPGDLNLVGRFGLKARQPTLDDFAADAYQGDMGITSALRPTEVKNPDGLLDDAKPGADLDADTINAVANYLRLIEIPRRRVPDARGVALFSQLRCDVCHQPTLRTRSDYPVPQLAGIDAPVYTDLLLHDLGKDLADGITDESALSGEWRTAPLIGLRFQPNYLHDGRAKSISAAIAAHGGQAGPSADGFSALGAEDQKRLTDFVGGL